MLVSTTLAGPGCEAEIVDALRSCTHLVDQHLILLSGADKEAAYGAVYDGGVKKTIFREYEWPNSYGEARTFALRWAESRGATWALTVDCDERIEVDEQAFRAAVQVPGFDVVCMVDRDNGYQKPRFIRCGVGAEWKGAVHERLEAPGKRGLIGRHFWELPKSPEAELRRMRRGVEACPKMLADDDLPQIRRHYGECLIGVGRQDEGFAQLRTVLEDPRASQFEKSWCSYRLCELAILEERFDEARDRAALALGKDPGFIQEFAWILAHTAGKRREYHDAALWANYALGAPIDQTRAGHRSPTWRQGCEDLLNRLEDGAKAQLAAEPQQWTAEHFARRQESFAPDYAIVARALVDTLSFDACLDLGAGTGLLVGALCDEGALACGVEANNLAQMEAPEPVREYIDYGVPLEDWRKGRWHPNHTGHDLVSCVEVAEHIPAERADELVDAVCSRARRWVYWSAATSGQGGIGHVNEQPQGYWIEKFRARGWQVDFDSTHQFVAKLNGIRVCTWLQRNALILKPL